MEHYFSKKPTSAFKTKTIIVDFDGKKAKFTTASGVFSKEKPDNASMFLYSTAKDIVKGKILDFGCGYGLIGIGLYLQNNELDVDFSDVNERAVYLAKKNISINNVDGEVFKSDGAEKIKKKYDYVLLNPPMAAGRKECYKLIQDSFLLLEKQGKLLLVARHQKGGKLLKERMLSIFGNAEDYARSAGFHVYISKKG